MFDGMFDVYIIDGVEGLYYSVEILSSPIFIVTLLRLS